MRLFLSSILVALAVNRCSGFLFVPAAPAPAPQTCVINCNDNTPICARSSQNGQCKYYSSSCGMQADNCPSQRFTQTNVSQCDGLRRGETGYCLPPASSGSGSGNGTATGNANRRRNRNRRNRNRRNRNNRNRRNGTG